MAQGDVANAKDDTRFYSVDGGGGLSDLATDMSHQADDLTVGTNVVYQSGAQTRWDAYPSTVELDVDMNDTDTGFLYYYDSGGSGIRIQLMTGGQVDALVDSSVTLTVTVPSIDAGGDNVIVSWSMEANPLTTGASDALRSELRVFNIDDSTYAQDVQLHAQPTSVNATAHFGARTSGGSAAFSGTMNELRFSFGRFHPSSEAREDFVANTAAPTLDLETRTEIPVPRRASGIGAHDFFTGPIYMAVAAGLNQADLRQASYLVNEHYRDDPILDETFTSRRILVVPDASSFTFLGQYVCFRAVPRSVNRIKARVHIQAWRNGGMGDDDDIVIRCYSMNRLPLPPANVDAPHPAWDRNFETVTVNADHGSGTTGGAWYTFDLIDLVRDNLQAGTWLALAFDVQDAGGAGTTADQRWRVRAWTCEPGLELLDGALPLP